MNMQQGELLGFERNPKAGFPLKRGVPEGGKPAGASSRRTRFRTNHSFPARQLPNKTALPPGQRHPEAHAAESTGLSLSALWGRRRSQRTIPFALGITDSTPPGSVIAFSSPRIILVRSHCVACMSYRPTRALFSVLMVPRTRHGFTNSCPVVRRQPPRTRCLRRSLPVISYALWPRDENDHAASAGGESKRLVPLLRQPPRTAPVHIPLQLPVDTTH